MNKIGTLCSIDAPITNVLVHLHCCQQKVLIDVEIHRVIGIEASITIYNMTSELSVSIKKIKTRDRATPMQYLLEHLTKKYSARPASSIHR